MSKTRRCGACDGTGSNLCMGEEKCPSCAGTGRDKHSDLWAEPCNNCNGTGRKAFCRRDTKPCYACKGSGVIHSRDGMVESKISGIVSPSIESPNLMPLIPLVPDVVSLIETYKKNGICTESENKILNIIWGSLGAILGTVVGGPIGGAIGATIGSKIGPRRKPLPTRIYTVQQGDCLYQISQKMYGTGKNVSFIFEANRDKISDPKIIHSGWKLTIPEF